MRLRMVFLSVFVLALAVVPAFAQAQAMEPMVEVADQVVKDGSVTIAKAVLFEPGFMVIHAQSEGNIGPVIGQRLLSPGENVNFTVPIDASGATSTLYAMLHQDTGEAGVYEFGTVDGADLPVSDSAGNVVTPPFNVSVMNVQDQLLDGSTYTAASVTMDVPGWLVIHADNNGAPGPVLGQTLLTPGTTNNVVVELAEEGRTPVLWPMLHVDTGAEGEYEFGAVEGADGPVVINGVVATAPVWTVPHMRVADQVVMHGDDMTMDDMAPMVTAASVLLDAPGFLVIHQEQDGSFGPVAGVSDPLPAGLSTNVMVTLDPAMVTARLWPMLHVDTGEAGVYEFGTVEGADGPIAVDGQVVTFPINAAPSITYEGSFADGQLTVNQAITDAPGWLVIHSDNNGGPGPVLGQTLLTPGVNNSVMIAISDPGTTGMVFPMLHYDTGEAGMYEFGTVEDADLPVAVGGNVVVGPFSLGGEMAAPADTGASSGACTVSANISGGVNLRSAPSTSADRVGTLTGGSTLDADGQATGADGYVWYRLTTGAWVRSDVVTGTDGCASLPAVEAPAMDVPAPAATEES